MFVYSNGTDLSEVLLANGQQSSIFVELARDVFPPFIAGLTATTGIYEIIPGFLLGLVAAVFVTLIDKKPSADVEEIFKNATNNSIDD